MKVIVAYSGGLDTSVIVKWVKEKYNAEVIGFCADVGQEEELNGVEEKAIRTGASSGEMTEVLDGISEEEIVVTGLISLTPKEMAAPTESNPFMPTPPGRNNNKKK